MIVGARSSPRVALVAVLVLGGRVLLRPSAR